MKRRLAWIKMNELKTPSFPYYSSYPPFPKRTEKVAMEEEEGQKNWSSRENLLQRARNQVKTTGSVRLCMPLFEYAWLAYSY